MHYHDIRVSLGVITNNPDIIKHYHDSPGIRLCIITTIQAFVCNITTIQVSLCIITTIEVICALSQQSRYALSRQSRYLYALSLQSRLSVYALSRQSRFPFMHYYDNPGIVMRYHAGRNRTEKQKKMDHWNTSGEKGAGLPIPKTASAIQNTTTDLLREKPEEWSPCLVYKLLP